MRKLLLIFFLLFPIYGACGEVNEEKKPEEKSTVNNTTNPCLSSNAGEIKHQN